MPSPPDPHIPPAQGPRPVPPAGGRSLPPLVRRTAEDDEAERLLTRANIQLRRGLTADAETDVHALLARRPQDAGAWEMLADIRLSRQDLIGTRDALKKSLEAQPGRATAEVKLGRIALQISERERMQTLGMSYAGGEASLVRFGEGSGGRGSSWATLASAFIPGLGQYVNGEVIKGIIVAAVYFLSLAGLALLPDTQNLLHSVAGALAVHAQHHTASADGVGVGGGALLLLMTADWLYSIVDAAMATRRASALSGSQRLHP